MKKGVILEQHRKYTILLTEDGAFQKGIVHTKTATIGEEVYFKPIQTRRSFLFSNKKSRHLPARILSVACILLLCYIPFSIFFPSNPTYAYVMIDINPSIEIEIDNDYVVRNIRPVNDDATLVTNELVNYKNKTLDHVIQMIIDKSEEMDLVNDDKNILVGVSFLKGNEDKKEVINKIEKQVVLKEPEWNFATFHVPRDIRVLADENKTSMNEMLANEYVVNADEDLHSEYIIDEEEVEIISSFYEPDDDKKENQLEVLTDHKEEEDEGQVDIFLEDENEEAYINQEEKEETNESTDENGDIEMKENKDGDWKELHPSELKGKNGEIHSNGNNSGEQIKKDHPIFDENHPGFRNGNHYNGEQIKNKEGH